MNAALRTLLASLALAGCAHPTDRLTWVRDMPDFQLRRVVWNHIQGERVQARMQNLCADSQRLRHDHYACVVRIREGGQCVVYSIYSEAEAKSAQTPTRDTVYGHEVGKHCGRDMLGGGGWKHLETRVSLMP